MSMNRIRKLEENLQKAKRALKPFSDLARFINIDSPTFNYQKCTMSILCRYMLEARKVLRVMEGKCEFCGKEGRPRKDPWDEHNETFICDGCFKERENTA